MKVELISHTPEPLSVIYKAFRQCYSKCSSIEEDIDVGKATKFVEEFISSGHESPIEHVTFTFAIEGVSRALTHQLIRHRIASYSQQSQRYVSSSGFSYVTPPSVYKLNLVDTYAKYMETIREMYENLIELGLKKEDARYILPNATETKLVVTMNCRSLLNFFEHRCCTRAQHEIRKLAFKMLAECKKVLPAVFKEAGAACKKDKLCPELPSMNCGLFPSKERS